MRPAGPAPIMQTSCCSALDWCLESRGIMLTGAFSLMGSGRGVASSSLPLTRVSLSMSTSPSLLPPRGLEAPLDILGFSRGPHRTRTLYVSRWEMSLWALLCSLLLLPSGFALCEAEGFLMGNDDGWRWRRRNANASEASTTRSDFRMQAQAAASDCVTVETCRESAESLSLCCPSTTPRCTSVWRIRFPCRKLPMTAGRAYGGS